MKSARLILSLAICVPLGALCGALYAFDTNAVQGVIGGAIIGLVMGMAFGGVVRAAEFIYGPQESEE